MIKAFNILFLSSWYPSRAHTTNGNFIKRHAEAIALKHKVFLLYVQSDINAKTIELDDNRVSKNLREIIIYYPRVTPGLFSTLKKFYWNVKAYKVGLKLLPEIAIIHGNVIYPVAIWALWLRFKLNKPLIFTEHWSGYFDQNWKGLSFITKLIIRSAVKRINEIISVSEDLKTNMLKRRLKNNYSIIGNVIDTSIFVPKPPLKTNKFIFLHVSNLDDKVKNLSGIIEAFSKVCINYPNSLLRIVGDGDISPHLIYAHSMGLNETNFSIEGEKPLEDIAIEMQRSNCLVLNSHFETQGCVILEAFSCGLPVISTNVGGIKEILNADRGILIKANMPNELISAMERILNMKFDSQAMRHFIEEGFSIKSVSEKFNSLYQRISN
ncbi:MAG TPA: glycosyltransferase family 4 protein [Bacteroidetes bacterium]|nr:glycosyltransferase family 4 protein [Bacteroidota bacterium]